MNWKEIGAFTGAILVGVVLSNTALSASAQSPATPPSNGAQVKQPPTDVPPKPAPVPETRITPEQAKELFKSVDEILQFSSEDSKLPIKSKVKRRLTTREEVEQYILEKLKNDEDAKRMERGEIVLKKFGLLDHDFQLGPFLVSLLKEQIAGYYDNKSKTVNLLDWIEPDQQKSVLAHELTHALQDQHVDLEKFESKTPNSVPHNVTEDNEHLAVDEADTARDAALEGQAMAVFLDYELKPTGRSLLTSGEEVEDQIDSMGDASGSPVLGRAPLLLQQSLLFPYKDGLRFELALLKDKGAEAAYAGVLDRPPSTSYEVINPKFYEQGKKAPLLRMPDTHELLGAEYEPYDIGVMGQLDVGILTELFGGREISKSLTPEWAGGIYYALQKKSAKTPQEKSSTASLSLLYLSNWRTELAAQAFATMYAKEVNHKYSSVSRSSEGGSGIGEQVFTTNEGPVLIAVNGTQVFVSESFELTQARKLELLMTGAQQSELQRTASLSAPQVQGLNTAMRRFLSSCGMMKLAMRH